jgi:hypothetical protein
VGGQRTLRPYWRNYFEQTDALVWVVDSSDRLRLGDCKDELHSLLLEDVRTHFPTLFGTSCAANVTVSSLSEIGGRVLACFRQQAGHTGLHDGQGDRAGQSCVQLGEELSCLTRAFPLSQGAESPSYQVPSVEHHPLQRDNRIQPTRGT